MQCALCRNKECLKGKNCTIIKYSQEYSSRDLRALKISAWLQAGPGKRTKLEEVILYAKKMGYTRIGIAFCIEYEREARIAYEVLSRYFDVFSVCCKVSGIDKGEFDLPKSQENEFEAACNPVGQAITLNRDLTALNLTIGLKAGHDILFTEKSDAPVICLEAHELAFEEELEIDFIE